ncbi:MAG: tRNA lysidine(34) synthetase TilS [Sedimenticola sp.]|nr:MAG: tRNA lysidine(34) synthetase TilS [Sedimenticola sp.]
MPLSPEILSERIAGLPDSKRLLLGFSGGLDSQVLLHLLAGLKGEHSFELIAIHVNHGLQEASADWGRDSDAVCKALKIPYKQIDLKIERVKGQSLEAQARNARYHAFQQEMQEGDVLVTAHHQDDQAETMMLQLLRGSGVSGLAAMPELAAFGPGHLFRPLLDVSRSDLESYANTQGLRWVEDASNLDTDFDRNYLRHNIFPLLKQRWPGVGRTLSRSAGYCAEARDLLEVLAEQDLAAVINRAENTLSVPGLAGLSDARARSVLRHWIQQSGFSYPNSKRVHEITTGVIHAQIDRTPVVQWQGCEVRRYRDRLFIMPPLQFPSEGLVMAWNGEGMLELPCGLGRVTLSDSANGIPRERIVRRRLTIAFDSSGLRYYPAGQHSSRSLKNYFQEQGVPPWQRGRIPLLFAEGELLAVGDLLVNAPVDTLPDQNCARLNWLK